jgi:hypothetical protein
VVDRALPPTLQPPRPPGVPAKVIVKLEGHYRATDIALTQFHLLTPSCKKPCIPQTPPIAPLNNLAAQTKEDPIWLNEKGPISRRIKLQR